MTGFYYQLIINGGFILRDFTLSKYRELLETIKSTTYGTTTVHDHLISPRDKYIILRHDVDRKVDRNLSMARLEAEYGVRSVTLISEILVLLVNHTFP